MAMAAVRKNQAVRYPQHQPRWLETDITSVGFILENLEATTHLARLVSEAAATGDAITLSGDLGVGKTTFSQSFIQALTDDAVDITSPTFSLVHPYDTKQFTLWHCDFYRIESETEVSSLGLEEMPRSGVLLIEWPDKVLHMLPENWLSIEFQFASPGREEMRRAYLKGMGRWAKHLNLLRTTAHLPQIASE